MISSQAEDPMMHILPLTASSSKTPMPGMLNATFTEYL